MSKQVFLQTQFSPESGMFEMTIGDHTTPMTPDAFAGFVAQVREANLEQAAVEFEVAKSPKPISFFFPSLQVARCLEYLELVQADYHRYLADTKGDQP